MRIIHTSDWHLGNCWNSFDRTGGLFRQVERVCEIARERRADVLLVAGDIFERVSREKLHKITKTLAEKLKPLIAAGCHVVLLPGNHDFREYFAAMRALLEFEKNAELVHVFEKPAIAEIKGVQFIVLPYPDKVLLEAVARERVGETADRETRNQNLSYILSDYVNGLTQLLDPSKPAILATHIQIYGVKTGKDSGRELTYNDDICLASNLLPTNVSYIALGHIHQCQKIEQHSVPVWYSGSFDRMDMGERGEEKFVLLVEIDESKKAAVEKIPIESARFEKHEIRAAELEDFAADFIEPKAAFVNLTIECDSGEAWAAVQSEARRLLPAHWQILPKVGAFSAADSNARQSRENPRETVMTFLENWCRQKGWENDLPDLKQRAERLLEEAFDDFTEN